MNRRQLIGFAVLLAALILFPIGLVVWNEVSLATGKEVLLEVRPVDPESPFRGQYVALTYPIARIPPPGADSGDTVYVKLFSDGEAWRSAGAFRNKPSSGTFIRGRVKSFSGIEFGIETFYVEEGQAPRYEEAIISGHVRAKVVLDDDGGARLKDLVIVG